MNLTESKPGTDRLAADFPPVSYGDWHRLVETELKGVPFDKRMFASTHEGITLKPVYRLEDIANLPHLNSFPGFIPFVRGTRRVVMPASRGRFPRKSTAPARLNSITRPAIHLTGASTP